MGSLRQSRVLGLLVALLALGLLLVLAGCGEAEDETTTTAADGAATDTTGELSGEVLADGSSTVFPIGEAVADEFGRANPSVRVSVGTSGSGGGFKKFIAKETMISNASRPIKSEEADQAAAAGLEYIELPIAYDGLSVVVNPENDWISQFTIEELKKIWEPAAQGAIKTWQDVNPEWPAEEIKLYGPGTDSGTFDYFTDEIVGEEGASRGDYTASEDDNVLVQGVSGDKFSLGYFGFAYYVENQDRLKVVPVVDPDTNQAVTPSEETINSGEYSPLSRPLFIYVSKDAASQPQVQAFVRFFLTEGPSFISEVGYVPLPDEAYELVLERFEAQKTGTMYADEAAKSLTLVELLQQNR